MEHFFSSKTSAYFLLLRYFQRIKIFLAIGFFENDLCLNQQSSMIVHNEKSRATCFGEFRKRRNWVNEGGVSCVSVSKMTRHLLKMGHDDSTRVVAGAARPLSIAYDGQRPVKGKPPITRQPFKSYFHVPIKNPAFSRPYLGQICVRDLNRRPKSLPPPAAHQHRAENSPSGVWIQFSLRTYRLNRFILWHNL